MSGNKVMSIELNQVLSEQVASNNLAQHSQYDKSTFDFTGEVVLDINTSTPYTIRNRAGVFVSSKLSNAIFHNVFRLYEQKTFNLSFQTTGIGYIRASVIDVNGTILWNIAPSDVISINGTAQNYAYSFDITPTVYPTFYTFKIALGASPGFTSYVEVKDLKLL
jgi:hypothetical protein